MTDNQFIAVERDAAEMGWRAAIDAYTATVVANYKAQLYRTQLARALSPVSPEADRIADQEVRADGETAR